MLPSDQLASTQLSKMDKSGFCKKRVDQPDFEVYDLSLMAMNFGRSGMALNFKPVTSKLTSGNCLIQVEVIQQTLR